MLLPRRVLAPRSSTLGGWGILLGSLGACGGTEPRVPADISLNAPVISFGALGQTQQLVPTVTDQDGQTVNATVTWTSSDNGVATVSSSGLVSAVRGGSAEVTATAGSASASSNVVVNQTPTQLQKISGDGQTAPAGATLTAPLVVQVNDAGGSPIPGRTVSFTVTRGEGSSATATAITGNDGRASTSFTTGTIAGSAQELSVSVATTALTVTFTATAAADHSAFNIGVRYLSTATAAQQQAFTNARLKWEGAISADLADVPLASQAEDCGPGSPAVDQTIDDVLILVRLVAIDGPGNILGGAGPCYVRDPGDPLTVMGVMQFDTDDLEQLESGGFLGDVILHEMGHVLGIGTLWNAPGLPVFLADPSLPPDNGTDPHFTGSQAIAAFDAAGGAAYSGGKVPVEDTGDEGTADAHWRESVLDTELMTGFIGAGSNPLSRITIASLADLGYPVNLAAADDYSILGLLRAFDTRPKLLLKNDILRGPIRKVDRRGRITGELRR